MWSYARVSTEKDDQTLSLEEQQRWAVAEAAAAGATLRPFAERASAKSVIGRPILRALLGELEALPARRRPKALLVSSLDRLSRSMLDSLQLTKTLRDLGIDLVTRTGPVRSQSFADRAAIVGVAMAGESENEMKAARMRSSYARRRREGTVTGNKAPYGLVVVGERDVPIQECRDFIVAAYEAVLAGEGVERIARRFRTSAPPHRYMPAHPKRDEEGQPQPVTRRYVFGPSGIRKLLSQRRYRGVVVPDDLFDQVQQLFVARRRWSDPERPRHGYLLTGALTHTCGRKMTGRTANPKHRYYECKVCGARLRMDAIDNAFRAATTQLAASEQSLRRWIVGTTTSAGERRALDREIKDLERRTDGATVRAERDRLFDLAVGPHARRHLEEQLERLDERLAADRARLLELHDRTDGDTERKRTFARAKEMLADFWPLYEAASREQRKLMVVALCESLGGVTADEHGLHWTAQDRQAQQEPPSPRTEK